MTNNDYHEQKNIQNIKLLRKVLTELPEFSHDYFRSIEPSTSATTRIGYAYDLRTFFNFIIIKNPTYNSMKDFSLDILEALQPVDLEEYQEYVLLYEAADGSERKNGETSLRRKMSVIRNFYNYYFKRQMITKNPSLIVDMPKLHHKSIIRLDADEVALLLDFIEDGAKTLTDKQKVYYEITKLRDLTIFTLLLGTGMRVSELVGLDLSDIDMNNSRVKVIRKGGNEEFIYYGIEVETTLLSYLEYRNTIVSKEGSENALFLSLQKNRMSVRSVERMVKKYAEHITLVKKITPHKLRSTYGTSLYQETGDIYLVADVLGHKDVIQLKNTMMLWIKKEDERLLMRFD